MNVAEELAQIVLPDVKAIETAGVSVAPTLIVIPLLVAVVVLTQLAFEVISQVTTWLLVNVVDVNVEEFVPAFTPSTFHW